MALNSKIFQLTIHGLSTRKLSKILDVSAHCARIRLQRLSQRALEFHVTMNRSVMIREVVCFDGLENFAQSQYEPNNIQQAIGQNSLFIYDFNFAPMNRKGRMSKWQKLKNAEIVAKKGRFNPQSIRVASRDLLERLCKRVPADQLSTLRLVSDQHFQYRRVVQKDLRELGIEHQTISSKATRNYQNILFSVNHADLLIRQALAAFARETISFSKTHGQMCQKYALFMVYKNYMRPQFTKAQVRREKAHLESPAQKLGLVTKILGYSEIFSMRSLKENTLSWNDDWKCFWHASIPEKYHRHSKYA